MFIHHISGLDKLLIGIYVRVMCSYLKYFEIKITALNDTTLAPQVTFYPISNEVVA